MITDRDLTVVRAVHRYYVLNRPQIQRLCFGDHTSGRATRRRLQALVSAGFINRLSLVVHHPQAGSPGPVYYPARRGLEVLAEHFDDEGYLAGATQPPQSHQAFHWLAVSDTHIAFDAAIQRQDRVTIESWINEYDVVNPTESSPEKRFRLYSVLRESPRLVCAPDAAFLLAADGHTKVFYLEQDRNTSGVRRVAASKSPGYASLAQNAGHVRHFPQATVGSFAVVLVAPTARRRDALVKAVREKEGASLWRFVAACDLTPDGTLFAPIYHRCNGDPVPLVRLEADGSDQEAAS